MELPTKYITSKGEELLITEMNVVHLSNAVKKIQREIDKGSITRIKKDLLLALETELATRPEPLPDNLPGIKLSNRIIEKKITVPKIEKPLSDDF